MTNDIPNWSDSFGKQIAFGSVNEADLPAYHSFSPIRYRLLRDAADGDGFQRTNPQYNDLPFFEDQREDEEDVFVLSPNQGEALQWKTASRYEYVVGYDGLPTTSLALSRELQDGDILTIGMDMTFPPRDLQDGYYLQNRGVDAPKEVRLLEKRNGNIIGEPVNATLRQAMTVFQRWALQYNWYNVGEETWTETYTTNKDGQINEELGTTSSEGGDANAGPGGRGPISGSGRITVAIQRGSDTDPLEVWCGSMGYITLGDDQANFESKWAHARDLAPQQTTEWEPLFAIRKDPTDRATQVQLGYIRASSGPGGDIVALSINEDLLRDSNGNPLKDSTTWEYPPEHGVTAAAATERTTDIGQFPDATGALVSTAARPGGYQLTGGTADRKDESGTTASKDESRQIVDGDYAVIFALPDGTNADFNIEYLVRESQ